MLRYIVGLLYIIGVFLTYGYVYNENADCGWQDGKMFYQICTDPEVAGMFWPIYWGGRIGIEVTK